MSLYFDQINVDDEIAPLERTPTEDQAIEFFGRDNPTNPAFGDAEAGRRMGFGGALVPGLMKMAWIACYAGTWAGPDSVLKNVRVAYRRPDVAGKPLTLAGRVVDKRQEAGKNLVELEVVILAEGQPSVRANVQLEVPSQP